MVVGTCLKARPDGKGSDAESSLLDEGASALPARRKGWRIIVGVLVVLGVFLVARVGRSSRPRLQATTERTDTVIEVASESETVTTAAPNEKRTTTKDEWSYVRPKISLQVGWPTEVTTTLPKEWSYERTAAWAKEYPACGGAANSPINIVSGQALPNPALPKLVFDYLALEDREVVDVSKMPGHGEAFVAGNFGSLVIDGAKYHTLGFHFHSKSDHQIDGKHAAAELHIVHQKEGCIQLFCLVVVGVMIEPSEQEDSQDVEQIRFFQNLGFGSKLKDKGTYNANHSVDLRVFSPQLSGNYYTYHGSLTTPPCFETVMWFVMKTPTVMTQEMLNSFPDAGNHRPVQELNGRTVLTSVLPEASYFASPLVA